MQLNVTDNLIDEYMEYFSGRQDAYALKYTNQKTGKTGYYIQCSNRWDDECHIQKRDGQKCADCRIQSYRTLNQAVIRNHLLGNDRYGNDVVAVYTMDDNDCCSFLAFDFDNHSKGAELTDFANTDDIWKDEVLALREICEKLGISAAVERSSSGKGAHVWIFFREPVPARLARVFGTALLEKGSEYVDLKSFRYYDGMLPECDKLPSGRLGTAVPLPWQGKALRSDNSAFVDGEWRAYQNQIEYLKGLHRYSRAEIEDCICDWFGWEYTEEDVFLNFLKQETEDEESGKKLSFSKSDVKGKVNIRLSNGIYLDKSGISFKLRRKLRWMATFSNRQYLQNQYMDIPNTDEHRFIYLGKDEGDMLVLPRGLKDELLKGMDEAGIGYSIEDERTDGRNLNIRFKGELKESQIPASEEMCRNENGILHAATAFGKTVVCCNMISRQKVSTLILVDRAELMSQWLDKLSEFLEIDEELPTYTTKSGQVKKRKTLIGSLQGAKDNLTGIVDVAMIRSLKKKDEFHPMLKEYGMVILDECHHGAADTTAEVLKEVSAKKVYGVTATPKRGDGKEKINEFLLGSVRFKFTSKDRAEEQNIAHMMIPRFTDTEYSGEGFKTPYGNDAFEDIRYNDKRDKLIRDDVMKCVSAGRTPVILTKYVDHAEKLAGMLRTDADRVVLLTGRDGTKARKAQVEELHSVKTEESLILVGTGSLLGEGFDYPRLDTLFMATPISGESVVEQYVGRLNRDYEGKENVLVYDYVDNHIQKFDKMFVARLKAYKQIGYGVCAGLNSIAAEGCTIYEKDDGTEKFWEDVANAKKEVVISTQTLSVDGANRAYYAFLRLKNKDVKCKMITWHPDAYKYGHDDMRENLICTIESAGCEVEYEKEYCRHYALIDGKVLWYGNMNLLSKVHSGDVMMRIKTL